MTDGKNVEDDKTIPAEGVAETFGETGNEAGAAAVEITAAAEKLMAKMAAEPIEAMENLTDAQRAALIDQRTEMLSLVEQSVTALVKTDEQFSLIAEKVDGWLSAHNNLVTHLNRTAFDPNYMYKAISSVVNDIDDARELNAQTNEIHDRLSLVGATPDAEFNEDNVKPGQYVVSFEYPENPETMTVDEIDAASRNVARVRDPESGDLVEITRESNPALFAGLALRTVNQFTDGAQKGIVTPRDITVKNGAKYTLMEYTFVYEITSASTSDIVD